MSMTVEQLENELRNQPEEVRDYLASMLIETLEPSDVDEDAIEAEAHRRYLEMESGEVEGIDGDEVIAQLRARRRR
ncbi:MAG TPA: addiction module protein [Longimicrobium sp.]|nr:addiction module protein [Longimicrobium sp.]